MDTINFLCSGNLMGYLTLQKISHWADKKILTNTDNLQEDILLDISSCSKELEMISVLSKYRNVGCENILDYYLSLYKVLGKENKLSYDILSVEILAAYGVCNNSFQDQSFIDIDVAKYGLFFSRLSDYIELRKDGYSGNMNMPQELIDFLSDYNNNIQIFKELDFTVKNISINQV